MMDLEKLAERKQRDDFLAHLDADDIRWLRKAKRIEKARAALHDREDI